MNIKNWVRGAGLVTSLVLSISIYGSSADAVPADSTPQSIKQPSGEQFAKILHGDEYFSFVTDEKGHVIEQGKDGYWYYLVENKKQSDKKVTIDNVPKNALTQETIEAPAAAEKKIKAAQSMETTSSSSKWNKDQNIIVLLVEFENEKVKYSDEEWVGRMFDPNQKSVKDYYDKSTFGYFNFQPVKEVSGKKNDGIVKMSLDQKHPNTKFPTTDLFMQIIDKSKEYVDYDQYDTNKDGKLEINELHIAIVLAGNSMANGEGNNSFWAHKGTFPTSYFVNDYVAFPESANDSMLTLGTIVHELGHNFKLPDLYRSISTTSNIGNMSVMAEGAAGALEGEAPGTTPSGFDAQSLDNLGVVPVKEIQATSENPVIDAVVKSRDQEDFSILKIKTGDSKMFYYVENRQPIGYDESIGLHSGGIAIYKSFGVTGLKYELLEADGNLKNYTQNKENAMYYQGINMYGQEQGTKVTPRSTPSSHVLTKFSQNNIYVNSPNGSHMNVQLKWAASDKDELPKYATGVARDSEDAIQVVAGERYDLDTFGFYTTPLGTSDALSYELPDGMATIVGDQIIFNQPEEDLIMEEMKVSIKRNPTLPSKKNWVVVYENDYTIENYKQNLSVDESIQLNVINRGKGNKPTVEKWESLDESIVSVDDTGKIKALQNGSAILVAHVNGKKLYAGIRVGELKVKDLNIKTDVIEVDAQSVVDLMQELDPQVAPESAENRMVYFELKKINAAGITFDTDKLTFDTYKGAEVQIDVVASGDTSIRKSVTIRVVSGEEPNFDLLDFFGQPITELEEYDMIPVKFYDTNKDSEIESKYVTIKSENTEVVDFLDSSVFWLKGMKPGKTTITISYAGKTITKEVTVRGDVPVTELVPETKELTAQAGSTLDLKTFNISVLPKDATNKEIRYQIKQGTELATISGDKLQLSKDIKDGSKIELTASSGNVHTQLFVHVESSIAVTGIEVQNKVIEIKPGETVDLATSAKVKVLPENAKNKTIKFEIVAADNEKTVELKDGKLYTSGTENNEIRLKVTSEDGNYTDVFVVEVRNSDLYEEMIEFLNELDALKAQGKINADDAYEFEQKLFDVKTLEDLDKLKEELAQFIASGGKDDERDLYEEMVEFLNELDALQNQEKITHDDVYTFEQKLFDVKTLEDLDKLKEELAQFIASGGKPEERDLYEEMVRFIDELAVLRDQGKITQDNVHDFEQKLFTVKSLEDLDKLKEELAQFIASGGKPEERDLYEEMVRFIDELAVFRDQGKITQDDVHEFEQKLFTVKSLEDLDALKEELAQLVASNGKPEERDLYEEMVRFIDELAVFRDQGKITQNDVHEFEQKLFDVKTLEDLDKLKEELAKFVASGGKAEERDLYEEMIDFINELTALQNQGKITQDDVHEFELKLFEVKGLEDLDKLKEELAQFVTSGGRDLYEEMVDFINELTALQNQEKITQDDVHEFEKKLFEVKTLKDLDKLKEELTQFVTSNGKVDTRDLYEEMSKFLDELTKLRDQGKITQNDVHDYEQKLFEINDLKSMDKLMEKLIQLAAS